MSQGVTAGGNVSGISKGTEKKIMEKLSNAQMQNQPLALAVPEQQIASLKYQGKSQSCPIFVLFPKVPIIGHCQIKQLKFLEI